MIIKPLDYEMQTEYKLNVIAFDGRTFNGTQIIIQVINMNDNLLAASQACFQARIPENTVKDNERNLITVKGKTLVLNYRLIKYF